MKKLPLVVIMCLLLSLSSCAVIGGIFKAGMGVGIFIVVAVVALIIFIAAKVAGK
jgi:hypothetical protein